MSKRAGTAASTSTPVSLILFFASLWEVPIPRLAFKQFGNLPNHAASTGGFVFAGGAGKSKWNVAPRPPSSLAQIRPPCDSTIDLLIAKPMPLPCGFV